MSAPGLQPAWQVDWSQPWFSDWSEPGEAVASAWATGLPLHEALNRQPSAPLRFVAQSELPAGTAYEQHVLATACCPTREGLHDFFNGLCWLQFPQTKRQLNRMQAGEIARAGVGPARGALRDALTLFDENAAFLQAPAPVWEALLAKDWQQLFVGLRRQWAHARLLVFGHALLEKLVAPRKSLTAHVYRLPVSFSSIAALDARIAADLCVDKLSTKPFAPLPVLGVPLWWAGNESPTFYDDPSVFRTPAQRQK